MRPRRLGTALAAGLLAVLAVAGCQRVQELALGPGATTPHEAYTQGLRDAGLLETALGEAWLAAADAALETAVRIETPFRESGYLPAEQPSAVGYRLRLLTGQELRVSAQLEGERAGLVFIDLFRAPADTVLPPRHVASADSGSTELVREIARDGEYIVRLQPELLRRGRYQITITAGAALAFPIPNIDSRAIQSYFGAPRDGGARQHHGVDIFAPSGTPVVAAAAGVVSSVRETERGGKVVWLRDTRRGQSLYYAHLDQQLVRVGERVAVGDTIGLVGNTGNARGGRPHLHFGVYRRGRGPLNPFPWIHDPRSQPSALAVDTDLLGEWARVRRTGAALRAGTHENAPLVETLPQGTALRVLAGSGDRYRVGLPDGREGFIAGWLLERASGPLRTETLASGSAVRSGPAPRAAALDSIPAGVEVPVLGTFGGFLLVRTPAERVGWVRAGAREPRLGAADGD